MDVSSEVLFERKGGIGLITLNRPKALNALTLGMIRRIDPQLRAWAVDPAVRAVAIQGTGERAFCAGGDVLSLYEAGKAMRDGHGDAAPIRAFFGEEYRLNRLIKRYPKPYVALIDGFAMGGGVGLSVHGTYRVVTERTVFSMPETGIGLHPDVGGSYVLPRLPGRIGIHLGLTGDRLTGADLLYAGVAEALVPSAALPDLVADLVDGATAEQAIARYAEKPGEPPLARQRATIDRCYAADSVEGILQALEAEEMEWAQVQAATLRRLSPTSLKIALASLRRGAMLEFEDCLRQEFRLSLACLAGGDFYEGVRALLIDKDRNPRWNPADLAGVTASDVERCFAVPPDGDLELKD